MLGIGFFEIVIIAVVSFIVVGPKELPVVMRKLAGFYRQIISLRDEMRFQILSADTEIDGIDLARVDKSTKDNVVIRTDDHG